MGGGISAVGESRLSKHRAYVKRLKHGKGERVKERRREGLVLCYRSIELISSYHGPDLTHARGLTEDRSANGRWREASG